MEEVSQRHCLDATQTALCPCDLCSRSNLRRRRWRWVFLTASPSCCSAQKLLWPFFYKRLVVSSQMNADVSKLLRFSVSHHRGSSWLHQLLFQPFGLVFLLWTLKPEAGTESLGFDHVKQIVWITEVTSRMFVLLSELQRSLMRILWPCCFCQRV